MSKETLVANDLLGFDDFWDKICKEVAKSQDRLLFNEMKEKAQITKPVLICCRDMKYQIMKAFPGMFDILGTDVCEPDKVYIVTDKELANNIRKILDEVNRCKDV